MPRRSILNLVSHKKRDTMLGSTTFPADPANVGGLTVTAPTPAVLLWNASARLLAQTGDEGTIYPSTAQRENTTCYYRGVKDAITVRTTGSSAWRWRRIIFNFKGPIPGVDMDRTLAFFDVNNRERYQRVAVALPFASVAALYSTVFRGLGINDLTVSPQDWLDPITAPIDTTRITTKYDKVFQVRSGNDSGVVKTYPLWHGINKNIVYNDKEIGGNLSPSYVSTTGKPGMGDLYIMDIIIGNSDDEAEHLDWIPTSTVYWHEK